MDIQTWLLYLATILIFMISPGPSHLLMISVGMSNGFQKSLATAAGDLTANAIQIVLAGFGLAAVLVSTRYGFAIVKWLGVAYLIWLGIKAIQSSYKNNESNASSPASLRSLWLRGFVTSAANPKAVVFFAALFPQFINPHTSLHVQVFVLGATYIVIDGIFLSFYGFSSSWLARKLGGQFRRIIDFFSGVGLITTAAFLSVKSAGSQ